MAKSYTEDDLRQACREALASRRINKTVKKWAILPSTLRARLHNALPREVAHSDQQRLSQA